MSAETTGWLFESIATMPDERRQRWRDSVYLPSEVDDQLADPARSIVVFTHAGCGLTTSLSLLREAPLLTFRYDPERWPGQPEAFTTQTSHFGQWMAHIADAFTEKLRNEPELIALLSEIDHIFLIWLLRHYVGRRQSDVWLQHLQLVMLSEAWQSLHREVSQSQEALYDDSISGLRGQIDECLAISRTLGWSGIFARIDLHWPHWISKTPGEREKLTAGVRQLLTTLTPLRRGFGIKLGLPRHLFKSLEVRELVRDRAFLTSYNWTLDDVVEITRRLVTLASNGEVDTTQFLTSDFWREIANDISAIWEAPGPAAATAIALSVVQSIQNQKFSSEMVMRIRQALYRSSAFLRLDQDMTQRCVWRGMTRIRLDETPFRFFQLLWRYKGNFVDNETLMDIAGSKANLDKNISRIRESIEPFYKEGLYLYVHRRIGTGTWIDPSLCHFTSL